MKEYFVKIPSSTDGVSPFESGFSTLEKAFGASVVSPPLFPFSRFRVALRFFIFG